MFALHSDYMPQHSSEDLVIPSRKASAMLSQQTSTPHGRKTSVYFESPRTFEMQADDADGEKLADRFQVLEELGSGSFGVVYKAIDKSTGEIVAVKHVDLESSEEDLSDIISELSVLSSCASNRVTKYMMAFLRRQTLWIVMEYLGGGSCADLLKPPPHSLGESHIAIICRELLLGLSYLHNEGKIHRDIKAANVLLGMDGRVKLADFGVATQLSGLKSVRNTFVGTPFWMAPEVIQQEGHDAKADVWSLGITAMELANGEPPHANIHPMKVLFQIPKQPAPRLEGQYWSRDFKDFVGQCLTKDVDERPSAKQLLSHRFIKYAGKIEGLQELIQHKQEWDASRGAEKNLKYYAETLRQLRPEAIVSSVDDESDDWVFETVRAVPTMNQKNKQNQKRRKAGSIDLGSNATKMMEDPSLDRRNSINTMRKVSYAQQDSPGERVQQSNTKKRISNAHRQPLGVNMSFGNSPSGVRQFRRVSPSTTTPDLENDDPLQVHKKSPSKVQVSNPFATTDAPAMPSIGQDDDTRMSRFSSTASTLAVETKEQMLGRKLYSSAIGISCQEVLNETGDEAKREAVARLAEAFSDLESSDPEGVYHIMTSVISRMAADSKLKQMLPQPTPAQSRQVSYSGTVQRTPVSTPSKPPGTPRLVMAKNNPHLKSHRRRQSEQVGLNPSPSRQPSRVNKASRDNSSLFSDTSDESIIEKELTKAMSPIGQLEHTRNMADVMFERWCEGLRIRWPAV